MINKQSIGRLDFYPDALVYEFETLSSGEPSSNAKSGTCVSI